MAIFRRNKIWWTDFSVNGQRFRQSLKTSDWRQAQSEERKLIAQAEQGKISVTSASFARLSFTESAERYLQGRSLELSASSLKKERQLLVQPKRFFGTETLSRIDTEALLSIREWRVKSGVGSAIINMEMGAIRRILKRAKRWHLVAADIRPLKERRAVGRALSADEKLRLLRVAGLNEEWQNARLAMILALNTTMRGCEIKSLRWRDIDLMERVLTIRKSKTDAGERVIPLNATAFSVVMQLRERAKAVGSPELDHFIFPSCENGHINPASPQKSWRSAWRKLTQAIECPACVQLQSPADTCQNENCKADIRNVKSPTAGLRFHDLRHHAITELAESQASDQTTMAIAGHVSPRMLAHYSHVRLEAKRNALDALSTPSSNRARVQQSKRDASEGKEGGYDTSRDTNVDGIEGVAAELLEKNGRHVGTRTPDLYRVKVAL